MKVAAIQMVSTPDVAENLETAYDLLKTAAEKGAQLAVLPEYFCTMPHKHEHKLNVAENHADLLHSPIQSALSKAAKDLGLWVVAGSIPLRSQDNTQLTYNASLVYNPQGEQVVRYDKIHLFRFDNGTEKYDETRSNIAGTTPQTFMLNHGEGDFKVGLSICYDLRFPELYRSLSAPGSRPCDIMLVPAAFAYTTGQAHWEILLRARAIENQCYVIAAAQAGEHVNGRRTWGHSMVIDPWGEILAVQNTGAGVVMGEIDSERIQAIRTQLPALQNRMLVD